MCSKFSQLKYFKYYYYKRNIKSIGYMLIYALIQILLVVIQANTYIKSNSVILVARCCGILISFNMAIVVILIFRRLTTLLRGTKFGYKYLPLDELLSFHKFSGVFILVLSLVHTIAHCINLCKFIKYHYSLEL